MGQKYPGKANKKQSKIILSIFGEQWLEIIEMFFDDIVDLYPYEQWNRDTNGFKYKTVGASKIHKNMFYAIGINGNLYLKHAFSLFPVIEK